MRCQVDLLKLLVCPTVCTTLGLILLNSQDWSKEAPGGKDGLEIDTYININSDIYIVLVQILACSNVCRGS